MYGNTAYFLALQSVATVRAPEDTPVVVAAAVIGLTNNPTHGSTAQIGTNLTGQLTGLVGGEAVVHIWTADGAEIIGATSDTYTPVAGQNLQALRYAPTVDGEAITSTAYTVRYEPPVAGSLTAVSATTGTVPTVNVAPGFVGSDLTYTETVDWASISGNTLTLVDEVRTEVLTITATNSGGAATVNLSVEIGPVDQTPIMSGLTDNPTHGLSAQIGVELTGSIDGLRGGENVTPRWAANGIIAGANGTTYTPTAGIDLLSLTYKPIINGVIRQSAGATVRHAPPVAGSLTPVNATVGNVPTVDLTLGFTGEDLTYTENEDWASISGSTLTIADEERTDTVTITATNSGGAATVDQSVVISAVAAGITAGNSATSTVPSNVVTHLCDLPTGLAEGDVVVVIAASDLNPDGYTVTGGGITWTEVFDETNSNAPAVFMAYGVVGSSPGSQFTMDVDQGRGAANIVLAKAFTGVNTTTVLDAAAVSATGGSGMPDAPSLTTSSNNAMRLIAGYLDDDTITMTMTGGDGIATHNTSNASIALAWKLEPTAGAFDPDAFGGGGSDQWYAAHTALRPA